MKGLNIKISTIIPIYNVEAYLEETIKSILSQDIGFMESCELILINDSSPDNSAAICRKYAAKYPENIRYVEQENAGVSVARNNGLKLARGEYVHFLDSDDIISKDAYSKALQLLENNKDTIDLVAFRTEFFDGQLGEHPLNHKFADGTRVIDLRKEPNAVVVHVSACILRRNAIKGEFDSTIKISEDMKFLGEQVAQRMAYGVVSGATYYYRKRRGGGSAIDTSRDNISYYTVTPREVYHYLLDNLPKVDGRPNMYAQYATAYDIKWRIRQAHQSVLTTQQGEEYMDTIHEAIRKIDDEVFLDQTELGLSQLKYLFEVKYGKDVPESLHEQLRMRSREARPTVFIAFINNIDKNNLQIEGRLSNASPYHRVRILTKGGFVTDLQYRDFPYYRSRFLHDTVSEGYTFTVDIPKNQIGGELYFKNYDVPLPITPRRQSKLPNARFSYRKLGDALLLNKKDSIKVSSYTKPRHALYEIIWLSRVLVSVRAMESARRLVMMWRSTRKRSVRIMDVAKAVLAPAKRFVGNLRIIFYRLAYRLTKFYGPVWIISDRPFGAGDNGEALNRYIQDREEGVPVKVYFAISRHAKEYKRLKKAYRNVIDSGSLRYKILFLRSSKIISSQAEDIIINPFGARAEELYDLFTFDFIFLQHGIIRNDMSEWLNRYNKNIRLFITSAEREYRSILEYDYDYSPEQLLLSGLPRFDLLENNPRKKVIIAPTWRHNLAREAVDNSGVRPYNPEFKGSEYYKFFDSLMKDEKLNAAMREHGYTGEFYLHPLLNSQASDFNTGESFTMKHLPYDYKKAFQEGSLMVTDYSSVFFDFAYLRKPVVYTQFDQDTYYESQIYAKGYMDDSKDGFGPVVTSVESAVRGIINMLESGCRMDRKYLGRVDRFYAWHDRNNSQRVYDAILKTEKI